MAAKRIIRVAAKRKGGASRAGRRFEATPIDLVVSQKSEKNLGPNEITPEQAGTILADRGLLMVMEIPDGTPMPGSGEKELVEALKKEQDAHKATTVASAEALTTVHSKHADEIKTLKAAHAEALKAATAPKAPQAP